ncbi:hypothetical protein DPMN_017607 [Dreissena polymorpha]|uniref:Uncharacterized protein n=1 Tax=Dreissena polymorpha TaxID=45954 RepID=A0A9D4S7H4_DREPO|nr:hypothetical protein DPMN_017607 [Dreissena polymorpha]
MPHTSFKGGSKASHGVSIREARHPNIGVKGIDSSKTWYFSCKSYPSLSTRF